MIADSFLNIVLWLINSIIGWFPASSGFPDAVMNSASLIGGYLGILDPLVDRTQILIVLGLVFGTEIAIFSFKTLMRFISHIPFIGGKG